LCISDLAKIDFLPGDIIEVDELLVIDERYAGDAVNDSFTTLDDVLVLDPYVENDSFSDDSAAELAEPFGDRAVLHSDRSMSPSWLVSAFRNARIFASNASSSCCFFAETGAFFAASNSRITFWCVSDLAKKDFFGVPDEGAAWRMLSSILAFAM
jgi:hypothetical protein